MLSSPTTDPSVAGRKPLSIITTNTGQIGRDHLCAFADCAVADNSMVGKGIWYYGADILLALYDGQHACKYASIQPINTRDIRLPDSIS